MLISPELLLEDGLISKDKIHDIPDFFEGTIDIQAVLDWKPVLLEAEWETFKQAVTPLHDEYEGYCDYHAEWFGRFCAAFRFL